MQDELILLDSVELSEPSFGERPKCLDAVYVALAARELVLAVEDSVMVVAIEDESVVGRPAVGVSSTLPSIIGIKEALLQLATTVTKTFPPRLSNPNTGVFPAALTCFPFLCRQQS